MNASIRYPDVTCEAGRAYLDNPRTVGVCQGCGRADLPPRRKTWCSDECIRRVLREYDRNHNWNVARAAAARRDKYRCLKCGADGKPPENELAIYESLPSATWEQRSTKKRVYDALVARYRLEVNHIDPRVGAGYQDGCHNHLDNLETLCHLCHVETTKAQRRSRQGAA